MLIIVIRPFQRTKDMKVLLIVVDTLGTVIKGFVSGLEDLEIGRPAEAINDSVVKIGQNLVKNPGDKNILVDFNEKPSANADVKKTRSNLQNCGLCHPGWPQNKTEGKWKEL